jgi:hypothetical protein
MGMMIWAGKAFPNRFFVAISLLLCLVADGAFAAEKRKSARTTDCASGTHKNKPPCAVENPTGQVTVFWPKLRMGNAVTRLFNSKIEVWIDKTNVGTVNSDEPLTVSLPNGTHKLELKPYDDYLENIRPIKETQITVSAQKPLYFQIVVQGVVITISELDAATAQAVLSGKEPNIPAPAPTPASTATSTPTSTPQAAVSSNPPKDTPGTFSSLAAIFGKETSPAAPASSDPNTPAGTGTVYLYWPRPGISLSFLDDLATDLPVFLDGKRIGGVKVGDYLVIKTTSGEHALGLDVGLPAGRLLKQDFVLGAGSTRHFHVENHDSVRMFEDTPEEAAGHAKGLKQRAVTVQ